MYAVDTSRWGRKVVKPRDMAIGDVGTVLTGPFVGQVVLKAYDVLVSLTAPENTWDDSECLTMDVDLAKKGESITLTVV